MLSLKALLSMQILNNRMIQHINSEPSCCWDELFTFWKVYSLFHSLILGSSSLNSLATVATKQVRDVFFKAGWQFLSLKLAEYDFWHIY